MKRIGFIIPRGHMETAAQFCDLRTEEKEEKCRKNRITNPETEGTGKVPEAYPAGIS
jgi:hypothetical protein